MAQNYKIICNKENNTLKFNDKTNEITFVFTSFDFNW